MIGHVSPARLGKYELIREIGRGGMSVVYLARDIQLGRRVAIKLMPGDRDGARARFLSQAQALAYCSHENIVAIYDMGEHVGEPFLVLEYLEGATLRQQMQPARRIPAAQAVELVVPVVRALVCAHEHAIVHRNLTPDNIFVTDGGTVKVLNFGTATLWEAEVSSEPSQDSPGEDVREPNPASSPPGQGPGTLAYRSPEQWMGVGVDHQSDIWAVGVILYEMLAGKRPLDPLSGYQLMVTAMLDQPMPSVRGDCPDLPDALVAIIDQCLVKQKARRVPSARQLLDALKPLLARRQAR